MTYKQKMRYALNNVKYYIAMVDPEYAEQILSTSKGNRKINMKDVKKYARIMKSGNWQINGESVIIDCKGCIVDGHHRLYAIIEAGITVPILFVEGVSERAIDSLDQGQIRQTGQVLDMLNITAKGTGKPICAIIKGIKSYKELGYITDHLGNRFMPSDAQDSVEEYGLNRLEEAHNFTKDFRGHDAIMTPATIGILYYLFTEIDEEEGKRFMYSILTGDCGENRELWKFHRYLLNKHLCKKANHSRLGKPYVCGITIKAWNAYRKGVKMQEFEYQKGEEFPKAI